MIRLLHLVAIPALDRVGGLRLLDQVRHALLCRAGREAEGKVQREREAIAVLRAEWQLLDRPDRLQALADKHLDLQPLTIQQLARLCRPAEPACSAGDEIGRKLEALGLLEPTATPKDKQPGGARAPSTRTPGR